MALFKSKSQRRIEREMEIRKGINSIRRHIRFLKKHESDYLKKAVQAKQMDDILQYNFLKSVLKRTATQRRLIERQLLSIETAVQMKNQAEIHSQFAAAMGAISRAISDAFGSTDLTRTQQQFEKAMAQAETMEERMELFLDMAQDSMMTAGETTSELVSDEEIEQMVNDELSHLEGGELDKEIKEGLSEIERELQRDDEPKNE
ncbi:MAG: hypothetical protein N2234_05345 [Planctomycetota bacterium]|nr:hypothetical protein [Planctomycetota bacterium]